LAGSYADATIRLLGDTSDFKKKMRDAQGDAATLGQKMQAVGGIMKSAGRSMTLGFTLPIVAGMALAVKAAIGEEKEIALLSKAIRTNTGATQLQVAATERWITKMQNATGIADGELRPALASLVAVTKNVAKAKDLMAVAMDIATAKGKPLESVTKALGKAYLGNTGALGKLGIATKDYTVSSAKMGAAKAAVLKAEQDYNRVLKDGNATAADRAVAAARLATAHENLKKVMAGTTGTVMTFEQVMKNARDTYGGAAATAANTTAGKMAILKAKIADLSESIGTVLIPIVTKVVGFIGQWVDKFNTLSPGAQKVIVVVALVVAAIGPLIYIIGVLLPLIAGIGTAISVVGALFSAFAVGGLPALGAAILAALGPVGLIIIGVTAIVAVFIILWKKCDWFRNFWIAVWEKVKVVFAAVWPVIKSIMGFIADWIVAEFRLIKTVVLAFWNWAGPFITAGIKTWWNIIKAVMGWIVDKVRVAWPIISGIVKTNIDTIKRVVAGVKTIIRVVQEVWDAIKSAARTAWDGITGVVSRAFDRIKGYANDVIDVINWVIQHVPGLKGNVGTIPTFGGGGRGADSSVGGAGGSVGGSVGGSRPAVSSPAISFDPGGHHAGADGDTHGGGRGGLGGDTPSWLSDLWSKFNIGGLLPKPGGGGLWGGATGGIYEMAKQAIIALLKKFGLGDRQKIVDFAKSQLGKPYVWGGSSPAAGGFDCSGLMQWAYGQAGYSIPRVQVYGGKVISRTALQPADILLYNAGAIQNGVSVPFGHYRMYAGGGQTVESGGGGVHMDSLANNPPAQIRSYLGLGGITRGLAIAGESGPEAVIPLTNARRGAAVMREAGLVSGGTSVVLNIGTVYARNPAEAQASSTAIANAVIAKLATAKRATNRGTP
jgi:hypothetical protein